MINFKKAHNFKILSLGIISIFLYNNILYADLGLHEDLLRIPVGQDTTLERMEAVENGVKREVFIPELGEISESLTKIAQHEQVNNILVFSPIEGTIFEPKLGETLINIYALIVGLHKKFPDANIYVATPKNEIFFAQQFNGKIIPVPVESSEEFAGRAIGNNPAYYSAAEWPEEYTVTNIGNVFSGNPTAGDTKRVIESLLSDKNIDIVFDVGLVPKYLNLVLTNAIKDNAEYRRPHIFEIYKPTSLLVALTPDISQAITGPAYIDRKGQSHEISGFDEEFNRLAPNNRLIPGALWGISIAICRLLGLDISADNLPAIELSPYEATGAWIWLNNTFLSGALNINKKTVIINLYAQTQGTLLSEEEWINDVIMPLMDNMCDSYFIFTRGEPGKEDAGFALSVVSKIQDRVKALKRNGQKTDIDLNNIVLLPEATRDIYPYINGILGLADIVVTLDTGMSHLANGVYDIDTILLNTSSIRQWETPRGSLYSIHVFGNRDYLRGRIVDIAKEVNTKPQRPAAKIAKAGALSVHTRHMLDGELLNKKVSFPEARKDLEEFIDKYSLILGSALPMFSEQYKKVTLPEIVFVDSAAQIGVNIPRFITKLYTDDQGKTYLMVDIRALSNGLVKEEVKKYAVVYEIIGHVLLRVVFPEFKKAGEDMLSGAEFLNGNLHIEAEEEVLARIGAIKACLVIDRLEPGFISSLIENKILPPNIRAKADDMSYIINLVIQQIQQQGNYFDSLSTLRYRGIFSDNNNKKAIIAGVKSKVRTIKKLFRARKIKAMSLQLPAFRNIGAAI